MSDNRLNTKILLRYDKYSRLMGSEVILQPGEMAVAAFPDPDPSLPPRAFGVKVGDGTRYFEELPWIQALAADVYEWAKDPTKPIYQATEIQGLTEYIQQVTGGSGGSSGSNTGAYRIIYDSTNNKYILQQWDDSANDWVNTSSEINLSSILNRINTIERWANGARSNLGNIEVPLIEYIYEIMMNYLDALNYNDDITTHQFVIGVNQTGGLIDVERSTISASDITSGVLSTIRGGTGLNYVDEDEILVGSDSGNITVKKFVTEIEGSARNTFATTGAIKDYVNEKTAGLTGAMHFIGDTAIVIENNSRVDPQIMGYDFRNAQPGDVILANNTQEYVWTGSNWYLLGDEGSYAIKGSITNADIAEEANIAQSKIADLPTVLDNKVDKVEGKQLSTNDYTTEEKNKLNGIEPQAQVNLIEHIILNETEIIPNNEKTIDLQIPILTEAQLNKIDTAQENIIEHIFVNNIEAEPTEINRLPKSIAINFIPFTQAEKNKLEGIESQAQVNRVETISFNGGEPLSPDAEKNIDVVIDGAALNLTIIEGARYPNPGTNTFTSIEKDPTGKILELSKIGATGDINDILQEQGTYIILNCGTSTTVI